MLSIQSSSSSDSTSTPSSTSASKPLCTPNLLPCRIHHNGPVNASARHWDPRIGQDGKPVTYFRGRKLEGKEVRVPDGYRGVVVRKREEGDNEEERRFEDRRMERENGYVDGIGGQEGEEDEEEGEEILTVLEEVAAFEEVIVWGHERVVEDEDGFVKGIAEWTRFAEAMHARGNNEELKKQG